MDDAEDGEQQSSALAAQYCAIGSVKTNVGHLDAAAGVAGLIKAALSVHHGIIPPTLHYTAPNPAVALEQSPFFVAANTAQPFPPSQSGIRRAAVSSFGIGGTNAHVILEQSAVDADEEQSVSTGERAQLVFCWSAKSAHSGHAMARALLERFRAAADDDSAAQQRALLDAAFTLQTGRQHFTTCRKAVVAADLPALIAGLAKVAAETLPLSIVTGRSRTKAVAKAPSTVFFFPGQGSHFQGMAGQLYCQDHVFRELADECWALVRSLPAMYPALLPGVVVEAEDVSELWAAAPDSSWLAPLALFTLEYGLSQRLIRLGVTPSAVCGHSLGHYVAAAVSGLLSLQQALIMLLWRSHLLHVSPAQSADSGAMLSIAASVQQVQAMKAAAGVEIAGLNSPNSTVVAGPSAGIAALLAECQGAGVRTMRVHTSHAFHSACIDHILPAYTRTLELMKDEPIPTAAVPSSAPTSSACLLADTVVGAVVNVAEAAPPFSVDYWVRHTRQAVQFQSAVTALTTSLSVVQKDGAVSPVMCAELGPGRTCITLLQQTVDAAASSFAHVGLQTLAGFADKQKATGDASDDAWHLLQAVSTAWSRGVDVSWDDLWELEGRHRAVRKVGLPVYAFDHSTLYCPPRARHPKHGLSLAVPLSPGGSALSDALSPTSAASVAPLSPSSSPTCPVCAVSRGHYGLGDDGLLLRAGRVDGVSVAVVGLLRGGRRQRVGRVPGGRAQPHVRPQWGACGEDVDAPSLTAR